MDVERFGTVTRTLGTRRHALGAAFGGMTLFGLTEVASAKKKRKKKTCKPKAGSCTCKAGEQCFDNGSCGQVCEDTFSPCPPGCTCGSGSDVLFTCFAPVDITCTNAPLFCNGETADCPKGTACRSILCPEGPGSRCVPLCTA